MSNSNQFGLNREKGALSPLGLETVLQCKVDAAETADIVAGTAVKIKDVAGSLPVVEAADAQGDDLLGVVIYNIKNSSYDAGDLVRVALDGAIVMCEAGAAIAAGANVEYVLTGAKVQTAATSGARILGKALNKAGADGDLIPVLLTPLNANDVA